MTGPGRPDFPPLCPENMLVQGQAAGRLGQARFIDELGPQQGQISPSGASGKRANKASVTLSSKTASPRNSRRSLWARASPRSLAQELWVRP